MNIPYIIDRTFVKLTNGTVWIFNHDCQGSTDVNAICIKEKMSGFMSNVMLHVVDLKNFPSRNMLIGTETDSPHNGIISVKDCSVLFNDFSIPVPGETKVNKFLEFSKSEELQMEQGLLVAEMVNTSLFLTYKDKSIVFYLLTYEKLKLKASLKIDLDECFKNDMKISFSSYIVPEIEKVC